MKNNILEYIILYVMVACAALVIATLARIVATSMGLDGFTAFMAFIIVLAIQAVVYLSIHVVLQNLMLPWIGKGLKSVKAKELSVDDLRHFGWNIWNFFKSRNQMDRAHFLKIVFPDVFREAEVESIKRHLKDDELKGIIKIQDLI